MVRIATPSLFTLISLLVPPLLGCGSGDDANTTDEVGDTSDDESSTTDDASSTGDGDSTFATDADTTSSTSSADTSSTGDGDSTSTTDAESTSTDTTESGGSLCQSWSDHLVECGGGGPQSLFVCEQWTQNAAEHGGDCPQLVDTLLDCTLAIPCEDLTPNACQDEAEAAAECTMPP